MKEIYAVIDETPVISDIRKQFYKRYISYRKELILDRAHEMCLNGFDKDAALRMSVGKQYSKSQMIEEVEKGRIKQPELKDYFEYEQGNPECERRER